MPLRKRERGQGAKIDKMVDGASKGCHEAAWHGVFESSMRARFIMSWRAAIGSFAAYAVRLRFELSRSSGNRVSGKQGQGAKIDKTLDGTSKGCHEAAWHEVFESSMRARFIM
jgi:hypothetical protein